MKDELKDSLKASLTCYLQRMGFQPNSRGRLRCPVHVGDSKTTAMIDTRSGLIDGQPSQLHCPKCGKTWDVFSLHAELNGLDTQRDFVAISRAVGEIVGQSVDDTRSTQPVFRVRATMPEVSDDARAKAREYVERCAQNIEAPEAVDYLRGRDLSLDTARRFGLGYDAQTGQIVIPSGESFVCRSTQHDCQKQDRYRKATGLLPRGIAWDCLESGRICWIVEGEFDALSLIEAGRIAAGLGGVGAVHAFCRYLESRSDFMTNPPRLLLALDDDDTGAKARDDLSKWLSEKGLSFAIAPPWHELGGTDETDDKGAFLVKDANDCLQHLGLNDFARVAGECESAFKDNKQVEAEQYGQAALSARLSTFWKDAQNADSAIQTGFLKLDSFLGGGLRPGLYVFGAIPSLGKTALILQIANAIASAGVDVLYFSLEMPAQDLAFRSISRLTYLTDRAHALSQRELQFARCDSPEKATLAERCLCEYIGGASRNLWIVDSIGALSVADIESAIAKHKAIRGRSPVVVVDYLQILQAPDVRMTDKAALDANALRLKQISNTYAVPMLIVSSFNRANYASEVGFESFKESGAVEYCADCLFGLQFKAALDAKLSHLADASEKRAEAVRQAIKDARAKDVREIELVILKNRTGSVTGERGIFFAFTPRFNHFVETSTF